MTIRTINDATMDDVKRELGIFLYKGITSEEVRSLAEQITQDKQDDIEAVYDWVKGNMRYVPDPSYAELFISPVRMAKNYFEGKPMSGDCDDHALFDAALLGSIGYNARIIIGDTNYDSEIDHAWAEVYSDKLNQWISVDTTNKNPLGWNISAGGKIAIEAIAS